MWAGRRLTRIAIRPIGQIMSGRLPNAPMTTARRSVARRTIALAAVVVLSACHQTIVLSAADDRSNTSMHYLTWSHHFLWGFVGRSNVDVRDYCPRSAVTRVEIATDLPTFLLSVATLGIYMPRRVKVVCGRAGPR